MDENSSGLAEAQSDLTSSPLQTQSSRIQNLVHSSCVRDYNKFCHCHSIQTYIQQRGYHFLQDLLSVDILENDPKIEQVELFASIIYMALVDARLPYGPSDPLLEHGSLEPPCLTVTDLLLMADININKLFHTMDVIKGKISLSRSIQSHLTQMERNYCIVSALFHTFITRLCTSVFKNEDHYEILDETFMPPMPESEGVEFRKKQCWALFLLSKYNLLQDSTELFQHFQLLLCCLEFVLRQTPSFLLNAPYDVIRFQYSSTNQKVNMLDKLAQEFGVAAIETLQLQVNSTEPYFQTLLNKDGELDSDSLCKEYRQIYRKEGDVDELLFLSKDSHLIPQQVNRVDSHGSGQPVLLPEQMTPVRVVVGTVKLLQENFENFPEEPSEKLRSYFQRCIQNPNECIAEIVSTLKEKFVQQYLDCSASACQETVAEQRFTLGLKLYYKVLGAMMDSEGDRLTNQVLNILLNKENFHKSLLACAMEVVLTTYGQSWNRHSGELTAEGTALSFPWILKVLSLQAYEFYKVVESFIKSEPKLPADVVKHLQNVEIRILDSLAWQENSSLFETLGDWDLGQITSPIPASPIKMPESFNGGSHSMNGHSKCAVDLFSSPVRPSAFTNSTFSPSDAQSVPLSPLAKQLPPSADSIVGDAGSCKLPSPHRSQSLAHFLKRVCNLGFLRLSKLCSYLGVSKDLQHKIWTCFEYCVIKMPTLLKNRHIDQIIMCCIYGICKVADQEIRFKSIVSVYKNLPHARQEVFRDVYITRDKQDSIINFYNSIFMNDIKSFILQFSPNRHIRPHLSPMPKQTLTSPSYSLPSKRNFTVSPLKESPFKAPASPGMMTPRTRLLYNFGESSSEKLKEFNETIFSRIGPASAKKRLNMDDMRPVSVPKVRKAMV